MLNHKLSSFALKAIFGIFLFIGLVFSSGTALAADQSFAMKYGEEIILLLLIAVVFVLVIAVGVLSWLVVSASNLGNSAEGSPSQQSGLGQIWDSWNYTKPIEQERDLLLDHDYDGIKELDNHLPPWWKWLFYGTIIFSVVYVLHYDIFGSGDDQYQEYYAEVSQAESVQKERLAKLGGQVDETNVTLLTDAASLSRGKATYDALCAACHGMAGEGLVGPNFTDEYWIHGGNIKDVFKTTKYGVPAKGMIAWQGQLKPKEIQEVSSYILSLVGTNPPNPKAPEGELYKSENSGTQESEEVLEEAKNEEENPTLSLLNQ